MNSVLVGVLMLAGLALLFVVPIVILWALNTLFGLGLGYTIANYCAVVVLVFVMGGNLKIGKK